MQSCLDSATMEAGMFCHRIDYSSNAVPAQSLDHIALLNSLSPSPHTIIQNNSDISRSTHQVRACWRLPWVHQGPFGEGAMLGRVGLGRCRVSEQLLHVGFGSLLGAAAHMQGHCPPVPAVHSSTAEPGLTMPRKLRVGKGEGGGGWWCERESSAPHIEQPNSLAMLR